MNLVTAILCVAAAATGYDRAFDDSVAAYDRGDYAEAIRMLEQIVDEGVRDADVFYNLGNAYFRSGRFAESVANYERVLQLDPRHQPAADNLELALKECPRVLGRPLPPEWERGLLFWHSGFRPESSAVLAALFWLAGWTLLIVRQFFSARYVAAAGVILVLFGALFGFSWYAKSHPIQLGVTASDEVAVRYGTSAADKVRFELFLGDRVQIEDRSGDWVRVATIGNERGWVPADRLFLVGPPYHGFGDAHTEDTEP